MVANWTAVSLKLPTLSKPGYTCKWYSAPTSGTEVGTSGANYMPSATESSSITVYARCTANTYTISYTLNGGSKGTNGPTSGTYDTNVTISNATKTITITGDANGTGATVGKSTSASQTFAGWTSTTLGNNAKTGTTTNPDTSWTGTSTKNTYFKNLRETGTVTMVANWIAVSLKLPTLSKPGYTCKWYSTSGNSGGTTLGVGGANYTPSTTSASAITAYARCTPNIYDVIVNANGGLISSREIYHQPGQQPTTTQVSTASITVVYDGTYSLLSTISNPTRSGYTFDGWYTAQNGGTLIQNNSTVSTATNHSLFAHWTANNYTVTLNATGGSIGSSIIWWGTGASAEKTVTYNSTYGTLPTPTREGYTFDGWYTAQNGGTLIQNNSTVSTATNHSLFAHWTGTGTCNLRFYNVMYPVALETKEVKYNETYGTLPTIKNETCVSYSGWYTEFNGVKTEVTQSTVCRASGNEDIDIYAAANVDSDCISAASAAAAYRSALQSLGCSGDPVACMKANSEAYFGLIEAGDVDTIHYYHEVVNPGLCNLIGCGGYVEGVGWTDTSGNALYTVEANKKEGVSYAYPK